MAQNRRRRRSKISSQGRAGLASKARRAGVKLPPPEQGQTSERTRRSAQRAYEKGQEGGSHSVNPRRSRAISRALKREGKDAASHAAISRQTKAQAHQRTAKDRHEAAEKGAKTRLAHQSHAERSRIA